MAAPGWLAKPLAWPLPTAARQLPLIGARVLGVVDALPPGVELQKLVVVTGVRFQRRVGAGA
jgi:hypothetical protein